MAKQITRNDYYNLIRETGRIPKDDEYEIIPLDLSSFSMSDNTQKIVNAIFNRETVNRNGAYMLAGYWNGDISWSFSQQCGFRLHQVNSYNSFAFSDEQMAVFIYCEGDITLTPFADKAKYEEEKTEQIKFYKECYGYNI